MLVLKIYWLPYQICSDLFIDCGFNSYFHVNQPSIYSFLADHAIKTRLVGGSKMLPSYINTIQNLVLMTDGYVLVEFW